MSSIYHRRTNPARKDRPGERIISHEELRARRSLIPPDTRDFNARFFGDPIPGDERRKLFPGHEYQRMARR